MRCGRKRSGRNGAPFDDTERFESFESLAQWPAWSPRRDQPSNRLTAFGDDPFAPELHVAQEFAQPRLRLSNAPFACSLHDHMLELIHGLRQLPLIDGAQRASRDSAEIGRSEDRRRAFTRRTTRASVFLRPGECRRLLQRTAVALDVTRRERQLELEDAARRRGDHVLLQQLRANRAELR